MNNSVFAAVTGLYMIFALMVIELDCMVTHHIMDRFIFGLLGTLSGFSMILSIWIKDNKDW